MVAIQIAFFLSEVLFDLVARDKLDFAVFDFVVAAIERLSKMAEFLDIGHHGILNDIVGRLAALGCELPYRLFSLSGGQDRKYSLTNQKPSTSTRGLCWMQRQRYWVERCFEDGKSQCGMADYQLRLWNAWHHHMALVMMAMLFMLSQKLRMQEQCPLLSCADIERLLAAFLPRRDASPEQVLGHMNRRHEMRRRAIESHAKRNAERRF